MIRALWTAASGMQAQQLNIDVVAHNLANSSTTGFKKSRADFQDLMYQTEKTTGAPATNTTTIPTGIQVGLGVRPGSVSKIFTTGTMVHTGNELGDQEVDVGVALTVRVCRHVDVAATLIAKSLP